MKHMAGKNQDRLPQANCGPRRTLWSLSRKSVRTRTRENIIQECSTGHCDLPGWRASLWKGTSVSWWTTSSVWMNSVLVQQRKSNGCQGASTRPSAAKLSLYLLHWVLVWPHLEHWVNDNKQGFIYMSLWQIHQKWSTTKFQNILIWANTQNWTFRKQPGGRGGGPVNSHSLL